MAEADGRGHIETAQQERGREYVCIEHVTKKFGDFVAVNNVTLTIYQGEIFCLLGGSGCGKTTLLRMLAGFETPTSGLDLRSTARTWPTSPPTSGRRT